MPNPLCFILMPFGRKPSSSGLTINFDAVYEDLIKPAIEQADLDPLRADEEMSGGIIHKPMFERLILCPYAVCDLTTANANVFYELGIRHAVRPHSTIVLFAKDMEQLPFDVAPLRGLPYKIGSDGKPELTDDSIAQLKKRLTEARNAMPDSPVFQLVDGFPDIQRLKTDVFRDRVNYSESLKQELANARKEGLDAVKAIEQKLGNPQDTEAAVIIDLFLSYRSIKSWENMIALFDKMSAPLRETVMVQEQYALALNRLKKREEAENVLKELIEKRGPSSETYGILGRIYKDQWEDAKNTGNTFLAKGYLVNAIDVYLKGFQTDWRDAYPGINAVTLMEIQEPPDPKGKELIPIVSYAVKRRIESGKPDYWDYATLLELAVLANDHKEAANALSRALPKIRESWEPETTARNLGLILDARQSRGEGISWIREIIAELETMGKKK